MRFSAVLGTTAIAFAGFAASADAATLDEVRERDELRCGVNVGLVGFSAPDAHGNWSGFDVSYCRALAAAVLKDPSKVKFIGTTGESRFDALALGEVDVLARNSSWTFERENGAGLTFVGVSYYDGQGFMVARELGVSSAKDLGDTRICVQSGTTTEKNLADYFEVNSMDYEVVDITSSSEGEQKFLAEACDAYTADVSGLASTRAAFADPDDYVILPEIISKEPLGPAVRQGDDQWASIARWTLFALIAAEEYGVTSANIEELSKSSRNPEIRRLLGNSDDLGALFGLDAEWARRAIAVSGNYGEIFASTIGEQTPIGLPRGLNAQYTQGGLMYSPPFR